MDNDGFEKLRLPDGMALPLEYRVEQETSGSLSWTVRDPRGDAPEFRVTLLGATVSKMEELHRRKLSDEDIRVGIIHAVLRTQEYLNARRAAGQGPPRVESVMIRDTDLAELSGSTVTRVDGVPP